MKNDIYEKMEILANSAKYDVSCSSSGVETSYKKGELGATHASGICHTFTPDGRCVSLLKVLKIYRLEVRYLNLLYLLILRFVQLIP